MNEELRDILSKVRKLFWRYGLKSLSMDDIARELGISKKTLYQHVDNKADLIEKTFDFDHHCEIELWQKTNAENPNAIQALVAMAKGVLTELRDVSEVAMFDMKKYYPEIFRKHKEDGINGFKQYMKLNIERGKSEDLYRTEIDADLIAEVYSYFMLAMFENFDPQKSKYTLIDVLMQAMQIQLAGLINDKGKEILLTLNNNKFELNQPNK